jgi:hypothetical protein
MNKKLGLFFVLFTAMVAVFAAFNGASALEEPDIREMTVYANSELVWYGRCFLPSQSNTQWTCETHQYEFPSIERGETLSLRVVIEPQTSHEEVVIKSWINGYREDIEDETEQFDIFAGHSHTKRLYLDIPSDIDALGDYTLYVEVQNSVAFTGVARAEIDLQVQEVSNVLDVKSVEFYAGRDFCGCYAPLIHQGICGQCYVEFEAGSVLYADVVVKNMGSQSQDDLFVKISIPSECIERIVYLGNLEAGETEKVTLYLQLPEQAGNYDVEVEVFNEDVSTTIEQEITLAETEAGAEDVHIVVEKSYSDVAKGGTAVYSIYVANSGSVETFTVSIKGTQGWATAKVNPITFTLSEGQSKMVNIVLTVNQEALAAEHQFTVEVAYGSEVESYNFGANVTEAPGLELRYLLLIVGIVLAVAIVVLLILLLSKNGASKIEKPEEEYSYY